MNFDFANKTILIAEDEKANFLFVSKVLENTNANVIRAHNGLEAVELVKSHPEIDVVLMDIYMPEMDGFEASEIIHKECPALPIIAQTCYANQIKSHELSEAKFDDFISKPININKMLVVLQKYLHGVVVSSH